ncbi:MAG: penicillin-binding protein 2, partial [Acidobacteriota bacterium]|nr:penicillin-binding protein 2 [Acidobacteriota bacterium]
MAAVQRRIGVLFGCCFIALLLAVARTAYLGVIRASALRQAARSEQLSEEVIPAQRGTISDRSGDALAISEPAYDITADPLLLKQPLAVANQIAPILGESAGTVLAALSQPTGFVHLARGVGVSRTKQLLALTIPGIEAHVVMRRIYPRGALAAPVIGAMGAEGSGLSGLEYSRNALLGGQAGKRRVVRDGLGQPISIATTREERPGANLRLTI